MPSDGQREGKGPRSVLGANPEGGTMSEGWERGFATPRPVPGSLGDSDPKRVWRQELQREETWRQEAPQT